MKVFYVFWKDVDFKSEALLKYVVLMTEKTFPNWCFTIFCSPHNIFLGLVKENGKFLGERMKSLSYHKKFYGIALRNN